MRSVTPEQGWLFRDTQRAAERVAELERDRVKARALQIWRDRERGYPKFVQRTNPDALDRATGAWALCLAEAHLQIPKEKRA